jgi:hypothetical protein
VIAAEVFLLRHVRHQPDVDGSVWHFDADGRLVHDEEEGDDLKILGVYSTEQRALDRIDRARRLPGFAEEPDCFMIDRYVVDQDQWADGFIAVRGSGE